MDPFREQNTLHAHLRRSWNRTPARVTNVIPAPSRSRAEAYLKSTGIGDTAYFGPELEFFIFDSVPLSPTIPRTASTRSKAKKAPWSSQVSSMKAATSAHRALTKGGYFPVPPVDKLIGHPCRNGARCSLSRAFPVEVHHHEVGAAGQCEIGTRFSSLVQRADWSQIHEVHDLERGSRLWQDRYLHAEAHIRVTTAPVCTCNQSIWKDGKNVFAGNGYAGLSETALYYIGGIIKHARALNAFTNPSTNSYKRLVPGFEAPVKLAYSACNRSAAIRIPKVFSEKGRRVEVRFPDPTANSYLAFSALLMAGLDGIQNKINPGDPADKNLYDLPPEENAKIPTVCSDLSEALAHLDQDREFLTRGGVFTNDLIDAYIAVKQEEVTMYRAAVHPLEYALYFAS